MKLLIVDDEPEIRELLVTIIEGRYAEISCVQAYNVQSSIDAFDSNPDLDAIICDYNMPDGKGSSLFTHMHEVGRVIPFAHASTELPGGIAEYSGENSIDAFLEKPDIIAALFEFIQNVAEGQSEEVFVSNYCPVRLNILLQQGKINANLFIKVGADKFVKVLDRDNEFTKTELEHYQKKNIKSLYIESEEFNSFISSYSNNVMSALLEGNTKETAGAAVQAHSLIKGAINSFGLSPEVEQLVSLSQKSATRLCQSSEKVSKLLHALEQLEGSYLNLHSTALSYISCFLAAKLGWPEESTFTKLSVAAILHDILLENSEHSALQDLSEVKSNKKLTSKEREKILNHPVEVANLVSEMPDCPMEVDVILIQHHERPDGKGFPNGLRANQIMPISALFIIAHEIVLFMMQNGYNLDLSSFVKEYKSKYEDAPFKSIMDGIAEIDQLD